MNIPLSIVIVNWNGRPLLERCLAHLVPTLHPDDHVIVVDNGSHDDSVAWLQRHYPDITTVALPTNLGFAGGNNAALAYCHHDWILLINNDAFVAPDALDQLRACIRDATPRLGAVSATLVFDHAPDIVASAGILMRQDGVAVDRDTGIPVQDLPHHPYPVFGASGGAVALRNTMLQQVGLFADDFFTYLEDVDLALRMLLADWHTLHCPQAIIRHIYSATSGQGSPLKQRFLGRNRWRTLIRCLPNTLWWRYGLRIVLYDIMACTILLITGRWHGVAGRIAALRDWRTLRQQRHAIQHGSAPGAIERLHTWLVPAPWPWQEYAAIHALQYILQHRTTTTKESS